MHTIAFVVGVPSVVALVALADSRAARIAASVYGTALVLAFGTSAGYHRLARSERSGRVLQRLDHSMIFVLIAGSYTPLCVLALPKSWGIPMLCFVWTIAGLGVAMKCFGFNRFQRGGYALYPAMGWAAVIVLPVMFRSMTGLEFGLVLASGQACLCCSWASPIRGRAPSAITRSGTAARWRQQRATSWPLACWCAEPRGRRNRPDCGFRATYSCT
jgi:hemolysin III